MPRCWTGLPLKVSQSHICHAASMGLMSNTSSTLLSWFCVEAPSFLNWRGIKCSRRSSYFLAVCTVNVLIPKKMLWHVSQTYDAPKPNLGNWQDGKQNRHCLNRDVTMNLSIQKFPLGNEGLWLNRTHVEESLTDNPTTIPHGRLWDGNLSFIPVQGDLSNM